MPPRPSATRVPRGSRRPRCRVQVPASVADHGSPTRRLPPVPGGEPQHGGRGPRPPDGRSCMLQLPPDPIPPSSGAAVPARPAPRPPPGWSRGARAPALRPLAGPARWLQLPPSSPSARVLGRPAAGRPARMRAGPPDRPCGTGPGGRPRLPDHDTAGRPAMISACSSRRAASRGCRRLPPGSRAPACERPCPHRPARTPVHCPPGGAEVPDPASRQSIPEDGVPARRGWR